MCHEKYHYDPDLRGLANTMAGLPKVSKPEEREYVMSTAKQLLDMCTAVGMSQYLDDRETYYSEHEYIQMRVRLAAIRARFQRQAYDTLAQRKGWTDDEVPF